MDDDQNRQWVGEGMLNGRRTLVTFTRPPGSRTITLDGDGTPRIDGVLRPDIPVRRFLPRPDGAYERPPLGDRD